MPLTTKKIISDQVLYKLSGGNPDASFPIDERDIWKSLEQKINGQYKLQQFALNLPNAETIPDNMAIGTYENVAIVPNGFCKSKSTLPVMPISLPRSAGVNEIRPIITKHGGEKTIGLPFIPIQAGQSYFLQSDSLLNDLMGQISYEVNGNTILYSKDLTALQITSVVMKLIVFDMSQYGKDDYLPIPSDFEKMLVDELVQEFSPVTAETGQVNNFTTAGQNIVKQ